MVNWDSKGQWSHLGSGYVFMTFTRGKLGQFHQKNWLRLWLRHPRVRFYAASQKQEQLVPIFKAGKGDGTAIS